MVTSRGALVAALCLAALAIACKPSSDFSDDIARGAIEARPLTLEGEQVTLSDSQIQCGLQNEYWDPQVIASPDHSTSHLTPKGRELKFNDDLIIHDPSSRVPFIQVRGDFPLSVESVASIKDAEDKNNKLVEARTGIKIDNPCFQNPLPLMGVKHGNFNANTPVTFHVHFDENSGWLADKIIH
jgi:hypothetical protein